MRLALAPTVILCALAATPVAAAGAGGAEAPDARAAAPWGAAHDWYESLYTASGFELRTDARLGALFAALNACGLDAGERVRSAPAPRFEYGAGRRALRQRVLGGDGALREALQAFLDARPLPLDEYVRWTMGAGAPPTFAPAPTGPLDGLERLLARAWSEWDLADALAAVRAEERAFLRGLLGRLEAPLEALRPLLATAGQGHVALVANGLDAPGTVRTVRGPKGEAAVVLATPGGADPVLDVVRAVAGLGIHDAVARRGAELGAWGTALLAEARAAGAVEASATEYVTSVLALALALTVTRAPGAQWLAWADRGYGPLRTLRGRVPIPEGRAVDAWVGDQLLRLGARARVVR